MGLFAVGGQEQAQTVVTGTLASLNAASVGTPFLGNFNVAVWGTFVGTVSVEQSFDGGATWLPTVNKRTGTLITFTVPSTMQEDEVEPGVLYRVQMTAFTSGTANYRISEGAGAGDIRRLS